VILSTQVVFLWSLALVIYGSRRSTESLDGRRQKGARSSGVGALNPCLGSCKMPIPLTVSYLSHLRGIGSVGVGLISYLTLLCSKRAPILIHIFAVHQSRRIPSLPPPPPLPQYPENGPTLLGN
jgi:hypothetical protein